VAHVEPIRKRWDIHGEVAGSTDESARGQTGDARWFVREAPKRTVDESFREPLPLCSVDDANRATDPRQPRHSVETTSRSVESAATKLIYCPWLFGFVGPCAE
jgi:hypothetical protein